jgi:hypothetical protein
LSNTSMFLQAAVSGARITSSYCFCSSLRSTSPSLPRVGRLHARAVDIECMSHLKLAVDSRVTESLRRKKCYFQFTFGDLTGSAGCPRPRDTLHVADIPPASGQVLPVPARWHRQSKR